MLEAPERRHSAGRRLDDVDATMLGRAVLVLAVIASASLVLNVVLLLVIMGSEP